MKKSKFLYLIIIFSFLLLLQNLLILRAVNEMSGDARVVNYSGLVRGATQRLVKLELAHLPNDDLMGRLNEYIYGLAGRDNSYAIVYMEYEPFQDSIVDLIVIWEELKASISDYRAGFTTHDALLEVSERHFQKADEATHNAEYGSEGKLNRTEFLILGGIVVISSIVLAVVLFFVFLKRSERLQLEELKEKNRQLEEAGKAKSLFFSNMSHDIRTPLNGIIGMTTIASANLNDPERLSDCLLKIALSSKHLQSLVNDVLDMSKIESGKFFLNQTEINLLDFMENLISIIQPQSKAKNQELNISTSYVSHEIILADQLRLNQIFVNILSNAIKFTSAGGSITFQLIERPCPKEGFARFDFICSDTGRGMSKEFLLRLYESFSREEDSRIDKIEGTGLGMTIVHNIVEMMGGSIAVESEKDKGTVFTVTLDFPICQTNVSSSHDKTFYTQNANLSMNGLRILMAEDNEINTEIAFEMLSSSGMSIDCAVNGKEAVDIFSSSEPFTYPVILMDMQMPVMTGCEAAAAIRRLPRADAETVAIIAMTANAFQEDIQEALNAGMNDHVSKPIDFEHLKLVISKYVTKKTLSPAGDAEAPITAASDSIEH